MSDLLYSLEKLLLFLFRTEVGSDEFYMLLGSSLLAGVLIVRLLLFVFKVEVGFFNSTIWLLLTVFVGFAAYAWTDVLAQRLQAEAELAQIIAIPGMVLGSFLFVCFYARVVMRQKVLFSFLVFCLSVFGSVVVGVMTDSCYEMIKGAQSQVKKDKGAKDSSIESLQK